MSEQAPTSADLTVTRVANACALLERYRSRSPAVSVALLPVNGLRPVLGPPLVMGHKRRWPARTHWAHVFSSPFTTPMPTTRCP